MTVDFFTQNRAELLQTLRGSVAIISAFTAVQKTNDAAHSFKQESNFWYLCGISEPDWLLVLDGKTGKSWLVMPDRTEVQRLFDGGLSAEAARLISGVNEVITSTKGSELIQGLARQHPTVHTLDVPSYAAQLGFHLNPSFAKTKRMLESNFSDIEDVRQTIAKLRAIKKPIEIKAIQSAIDCTLNAFEVVRDQMRSFKSEADIEAEFSYIQRKTGATGHAYEPIVAAGINACTLHYSENRSVLKNRQLVLMDVGAEYDSYAADITRTYVRGEPTKRQQQVHSAVESAHQQIIALLKPHLGVQEYQTNVDSIMKKALESLGLGSDESSLRRYFPHAISHGLGIDVHDSLGAPKHFQENMVLTVEPGIYIHEERIGVRIEDDILITSTGHRNLSSRLSTGL